MTSGSSVSTCIALASAHLRRNPGRPPVGAAGNGESDPRARSTRNGPQHSPRRPTSERPRRPGDYDVNGWPHTIFSPERRSPKGADGTSRTSLGACSVVGHGGDDFVSGVAAEVVAGADLWAVRRRDVVRGSTPGTARAAPSAPSGPTWMSG